MISKWVKIGKGYNLDKDVIIGYKPERRVRNLELVIGSNAKIRSGTIIYAGSKIGNNLETGHNVIIREENEIGDNFKIWSNSVLDYGCVVGNDVKIHSNCYIAQYTNLEDEVFLGPGAKTFNDLYPFSEYSTARMKGPIIKKGAIIGGNASIAPYITVGEKSLIGMGSVVTKDVPPESVVSGNPAKVLKHISELDVKKKINLMLRKR
jgi:acetyltransferase-like isoleucine patch superfamily enzyme